MILDTTELKAARLARGMNQQQLATKSGVHLTMIYRIEAGRSCKVETMRALTNALGIVAGVPE